MLGIASWADAAAAVTVMGVIAAIVTAVARFGIVKPLENKIASATAELRADGGETMRDRVVRIDTTVCALKEQQGRFAERLYKLEQRSRS